MLRMIEIYFLLFLSYSFLGWCTEVICKLIEKKKFINRGFLIGPYCPIYGWGAIAITLLLKKYINDPIVLFIMAMVVCSILEYATSYILEKLFHARWWDYSKKRFNINGRICLETMIPFGILGCFISYVMNPFLINHIQSIPQITRHVIAGILGMGFLIDNIISIKIMSNVRTTTTQVTKDNTEEITKKVKEILLQKSILNRRLIHAFPKLEAIRKRRKEKIRNTYTE